MSLSPIAGVVLPTALSPTEPAPPATVDADHGVAVEFAALLAGLLRVPTPAPVVKAVGPDAVVGEGDEAAATDEAIETDPTQVETDVALVIDAESTLVETTMRTQADATPVYAGQAAPVDAEQAADATAGTAHRAPTGDGPGPRAPSLSPTVQADTPTPISGNGPATIPANAVATFDSAIPPRTGASVESSGGASRPVPPTLAVPNVMDDGLHSTQLRVAQVSEQQLASTPEVARTNPRPLDIAPQGTPTDGAAIPPGGMAEVVLRITETVTTAVRRLLGLEASTSDPVAAQTTEGEASNEGATSRLPAVSRVVARGAAAATSDGGGNLRDRPADDPALPLADAVSTGQGADAPAPALTDASRAVASPAGGLATVTRPEVIVPAGTPASVAAPPDPAPTPDLPQLVTVRFEGPGGVESRIRVSVRGDTVHATILTDAQSAPQLELSLPELQRSLADRGFSESRVSVRVLAGLEGALATTARQETAAGDGTRHRDAQDRHAPEREFAEDDRERGRRKHQGEEAHS